MKNGKRFGRLTALKDSGVRRGKSRAVVWHCICDCGNEAFVIANCLKRGGTKSCGCLHDETARERRFIHGEGKTKLYRMWRGMKTRCLDKGSPFYHRYGGNGRKICKEWLNYLGFRDWALKNGYQEGLSIDRIDNNGDYEPSNCQWLTKRENTLKWWHLDRFL